MFYVALVDLTNKRIEVAEEYASRDGAEMRAQHLGLQAEMNGAGLNPDVDKSFAWHVHFGEEPFAFPAEE